MNIQNTVDLAEAVLTTIIISLTNATLIICFEKWGLLERYQIYRRKWMPDNLCVFCLGFWMAASQCAIVYFLSDSKIFYIAVAFASASLTKLIYENSKSRW